MQSKDNQSKDNQPDETTTERSEAELLAQTADNPKEAAELAQMMREIQAESRSPLPKPIRYLGFGLAGIAFLSLAFLTIVLIQDVPFATRIYGPKQLAKGQRATYRIALFEPEKTRFLNKIEGALWLVSKRQKHLLFKGKTDGKVLIANVSVPTWPASTNKHTYHLLVEVTGPRGKESFKRPITLVAGKMPSPVYAKETGQQHWDAPKQTFPPAYRYKLSTKGRALIADLPNELLLQVQANTSIQPTPPKAPKPTPPKTPTSKPIPRTIKQATPRTTSQPVKRPATSQPTKPTSRPIIRAAVPKRAVVPTVKHRPTPPQARPNPALQGREHRSKKLLQPFAPTPRPIAKRPPTWQAPKEPILVSIYDGRQRLGPFTTDAFGVVRFSYMPQLFRFDWKITLRGKLGTSTYQQQIKPEGYQVLLSLPKAIYPPGKAISLTLDCLQRKGVFHIDIVQRGQRLWSTRVPFQGGKKRLTFTPPKHITGLASIQVYTEFYFPGEVYDARLIYLGQPTSAKTLLRTLETQLSQRGDGLRTFQLGMFKQHTPPDAKSPQFNTWARHLFAFAKARFVPPGLFYDSKIDRHKKLRHFQTKFRNQTLFSLGALGGLVLLGIFGWLSWGYRRDQLAMQQAEREHEDIDAIKTRGLPWLIGFFITLLLIFACIIYLFWAMKWTYDNL